MKPQPRSATRRPLRGSGDLRSEHPYLPNLAQRPSECSQDTGTAKSVKYLELLRVYPGLQDVVALVERVARINVTVLIFGPNGAGKELVAQAVGQESRGCGCSFVAANCAAFPSDLFESEVFGHVRGAFTGADGDKLGLFERAGNGSVFLDEIGELELPLQAKLLRVLQTRQFRRVGGTTDIPLQARVIAATNRDLLQMVRVGTFREDLYYRLNVVPIHVPPLCQRPQDIPLLARHFVSKFARDQGLTRTVADDTLKVLQSYPWPGNVRQLENLMLRVTLFSTNEVIQTADLPSDVFRPDTCSSVRLPCRQSQRKRNQGKFDAFVELARTGGFSPEEIQSRVGISRPTYYRWLAELARDSAA